MKTILARCFSLTLAALAFGTLAHADGNVGYNPASFSLEGDEPQSQTYQLAIQAPSNLVSGTVYNIKLVLSVTSAPAGVSAATALSYVSLPKNVIFTAPNQTDNISVVLTYPSGIPSGDYAYKIVTSGWPLSLGTIIDGTLGVGATINANIAPSGTVTNDPPTITSRSPADGAVYNWNGSASSPVVIPLTFAATVDANSTPITSLAIMVGNTTIPVTPSTLPSATASGTASFSATAAGEYQISFEATNAAGTTVVTSSITVQVAGTPPTVAIASPANNSSYTFTAGGPAVTIPLSFSGTSLAGSGNITALSATLVGPSGSKVLSPTLTGVGTALVATGTTGSTLSFSSPGTYTITATATNAYGTSTATTQFTIASVTPVPTISILTPANNATFQIAQGATSVQVPYTLSGATTFANIVSVTSSLKGPGATGATTTVTPTINAPGLNQASFTGAGTLTITAPGTYTLSATDSNGGATASATTTFTVTQAAAAPTEVITWLPPISLGQALCGGSCAPINFSVTTNGAPVTDTSIIVAVYQTYTNGTSSTPVIYTYNSTNSWSACNNGWWASNGSCSNASNNFGCGNWNSAGWNACTTYYTITNGTYALCFPTDTGANTYTVEVYKQTGSSASSITILGKTTFSTASTGSCRDNNGNQCSATDDRSGNCDLAKTCFSNNNCGGNSNGGNSWGGNGCFGNNDNGGRTNTDGYCGSSSNKSVDNNSCSNNNNSGWGW